MFVTRAVFVGFLWIRNRVWEEILLLIENRMSKQGYDTWFSQSKLISLDGNRMHDRGAEQISP